MTKKHFFVLYLLIFVFLALSEEKYEKQVLFFLRNITKENVYNLQEIIYKKYRGNKTNSYSSVYCTEDGKFEVGINCITNKLQFFRNNSKDVNKYVKKIDSDSRFKKALKYVNFFKDDKYKDLNLFLYDIKEYYNMTEYIWKRKYNDKIFFFMIQKK